MQRKYKRAQPFQTFKNKILIFLIENTILLLLKTILIISIHDTLFPVQRTFYIWRNYGRDSDATMQQARWVYNELPVSYTHLAANSNRIKYFFAYVPEL